MLVKAHQFFIILFFLSSSVLAQDEKTTSYKYYSEFEERVFSEYLKDSTKFDVVNSLMAYDSTATRESVEENRKRINAVIARLPIVKESKEKKEKKRIKKIYDIIHETFFKKYVDDIYFSDIFKTGEYNCLTASAIYSHIFEQIDIPYTIKEEPGHVYVIVYPNSYKIYLETTVPGEYGFYIPDEKNIKKVVDNLVELKLISKEELNKKGYQKAYLGYYFDNKYLDIKGLVGAQYYNIGLNHFNNREYDKSFEAVSKASVFYDSEVVKLLKKSLSILLLMDKEISKSEDVQFFVEAINSLVYKTDYSENDLKLFLYKIISNDNTSVEFIGNSIDDFNKINDVAAKKVILEFFYSELGELAAKNEQLDNAINYAIKIREINEKSKMAKNILLWAIPKKINLLPQSNESIEKIDSYTSEFPFLKDNIGIISAKAIMYGKYVYDYYKKREIDKAEDYLYKLEEVYTKHPDIQINPEMFAKLYYTAGTYYYGKLNYQKAEDMLSKGLKITPENRDLKRVLKYINEDKN